MHEHLIARDLLAAVLARLPVDEAVRVRVVRGRLAETEAISASSVALHLDALARGTPAEGALLSLDVVHVEARCGRCGAIYLPEHHVLLCPGCGSDDGEVQGEVGLFVDRIEVETEDDR